MRVKKIPLRKCIVCQEMKGKKELIRLVKTPEQDIKIDVTGKIAGRGAYLCKSTDCFIAVQKNRALDRALKHSVQTQVYEELAQYYNE